MRKQQLTQQFELPDRDADRGKTLPMGVPENSWQTDGFLIFQNRDFKQSTTRPEVLSLCRSVSFFTKAFPQGLSLPSGSSSASTWQHRSQSQILPALLSLLSRPPATIEQALNIKARMNPRSTLQEWPSPSSCSSAPMPLRLN